MGGSARGRTGDQTSLERVYKYKGVEVEKASSKDQAIKQARRVNSSLVEGAAKGRVGPQLGASHRSRTAGRVGSGWAPGNGTAQHEKRDSGSVGYRIEVP